MIVKIKNISGESITCGTITLQENEELIVYNNIEYTLQIKANFENLNFSNLTELLSLNKFELYKDDESQSVDNAIKQVYIILKILEQLNCMTTVFPLFKQLNPEE